MCILHKNTFRTLLNSVIKLLVFVIIITDNFAGQVLLVWIDLNDTPIELYSNALNEWRQQRSYNVDEAFQIAATFCATIECVPCTVGILESASLLTFECYPDYSDNRFEAVDRASGSTSHPISTSPGVSCWSNACECPPPPSVPSMNNLGL